MCQDTNLLEQLHDRAMDKLRKHIKESPKPNFDAIAFIMKEAMQLERRLIQSYRAIDAYLNKE